MNFFQEPLLIISLYALVISLLLLIRKRKTKNEITILADNCEECPFRHKPDNVKYSYCKISGTLTDDLNKLKSFCPLEGKLKIKINNQ